MKFIIIIINVLQIKNIINHVVNAFKKQYYIFYNIINNQHSYFNEFYIIIKQITCWFSQKIRDNYDDEKFIVNCFCIKNTLY